MFARLMGAPGDRNLASFSVNAGITLKAPIPSREDDTVGLGYGLAKISNSAILLDQDTAAFNNGTFPIRSSESFIELTYQAQLAPWLAIQPDFQYVWTPGGGIQNPEKFPPNASATKRSSACAPTSPSDPSPGVSPMQRFKAFDRTGRRLAPRPGRTGILRRRRRRRRTLAFWRPSSGTRC